MNLCQSATWIGAAIAIALIPPELSAQSSEPASESRRSEAPRRVSAVKLDDEIRVDGVLDESIWRSSPALSSFVQSDPVEGAQPTERTDVYVLYDEAAIYVGARMYDSAPDSIVARLGRRDAPLESDNFRIFLDPYHDRRSGYYFGVNAAGTLYDGVLLNDDWNDSDWDGVWEGSASVDAGGWTVEMRIPYSQLRFYQQEQYVWGINFRRQISRKNESDYLVYSPRNESGFVSRFWDLVGIEGIRPRRQIEIIPYVTSQAQYDDNVSENPFENGSRYGFDAGADLRVGITPNLTLNATVNPDFGQVEVDPAVINLSDFETFYPEKRPFFIEGATIFENFGYGGATSNWGFNWGNPDFFYSRRVGRAPQGRLPEHTYAHVPEETSILGAAKVTGKVFGSWNVGTVHALTARERAEFEFDGHRFDAEAEPAAYYGVYRAQKEFSESRHGLGALSTFTNRFFSDERLEDQITRRALVLGVDGWTFLDTSKTWVVNGWAGTSHVRGSEASIADLERSSIHYFQRPDAEHVELDTTTTRLDGWAGRLALNKQRGRILLNAAVGAISPSFDVNDVGFQRRSDIINMHVGGGYRWPDPGRFTRRASAIGAVFGSKDFGGNTIWSGIFALGEVQLLNYYEIGALYAANPETISNGRTRGGPLTLNPGGWEAGLFGRSDTRKNLVVGLDMNSYRAGWTRNFSLGVEVEWKPAANVSVTFNPSTRWNYEHSQWVDVFSDPLAVRTFGNRYVFAELDQVTVASSVRVNWTFTPELSFQLYAQPLISAGDYSNYKELARPRSYDFITYGEGGSVFDPETRMADPDGPGPAEAFELPDLDFRVASLRGTAVVRWEYLAGSTLYLVWTQRRSEETEDPHFYFGPSFDQLWNAPMENIFVVKLTYWFST